MKKALIKISATFFYTGQIPFAPGTWGSLAATLLYLALGVRTSLWHVVVFVSLALVGFLTAGRAESVFGVKDPKPVVIDEVAGVFLVFMGLPLTLPTLVLGFVLYRIFDIIKPPPARQAERLPGSAGIMFDDLFCGCYAHLALLLLGRWL
ncbi:MAG: phosphatidylglycerophosphatase A [Candidatus Omnitrophica bacterium]|nr:phosphatidylglycerophosphatase A [Candidatus Omnitrophota bacterium]MDD5574384.1 phosphatidylglycerophosphatase A [Candidatus Omnitrophota bacterium]